MKNLHYKSLFSLKDVMARKKYLRSCSSMKKWSRRISRLVKSDVFIKFRPFVFLDFLGCISTGKIKELWQLFLEIIITQLVKHKLRGKGTSGKFINIKEKKKIKNLKKSRIAFLMSFNGVIELVLYFFFVIGDVDWKTLEAAIKFSMYWPRTWFSDLSFKFSSLTLSTLCERSEKKWKN